LVGVVIEVACCMKMFVEPLAIYLYKRLEKNDTVNVCY